MGNIREVALSLLSGEAQKTFYIGSQAFYWDSTFRPNMVEDLTIGLSSADGGTFGEFSITWEHLGGNIASCIHMWNDAWFLYQLVPECFEIISNLDRIHHGGTAPVEAIAGPLLDLGWKDTTRRDSKSADRVARVYPNGEIPLHLRNFFPQYTYYVACKDQDVDMQWVENLSGKCDVEGGVYFLDNEEDYTLTKVRFS